MRAKETPPYSFVTDELAESRLGPRIRLRAMFGCRALYIDEKIVFILRRKADSATERDNGVWIAIAPDAHASMTRELPALRPIEMFQTRSKQGFSGWLNLPELEEGFEEAALRACRLVIDGDLRIGRIPKGRKPRKGLPGSK